MRWIYGSAWVCLAWFVLLTDSVGAQSTSDFIRQHRFREALAALPAHDEGDAEGSFVRAELCLRLGQWGCAADALSGSSAGLPDGLEARWRRLRAHALVRARRLPEAVEVFDDRSFPHSALTRALHAEARVGLGQSGSAVAPLREAIRQNHAQVDTFALRLLLARALRESGEEAGSENVLREAYVRHPDHPEAENLRSEVTLSASDRLRRAERLSSSGRHAEAAQELRELPESEPREFRARWLHQRGMSLFRSRGEYLLASQVLSEAARLGGPHAQSDAFHAARALSRADRDEASVRAYDAFVRNYRSSPKAIEAEFLAGWLSLRHGFGDGEARLRRLSRRRRVPPVWRDKAAWLVSFAQFDSGRFVEASRGFAALRNSEAHGMQAGRAWYWFGRAALARGRRGEAFEAWRQVIRIEPLHWYGLLAAARLRAHEVEPPPPFASDASVIGRSEWTFRAEGPALPDAAEFLHRWGLDGDAASLVSRFVGRHGEGMSPQHAVQLLTAVGDVNGAFLVGLRRGRSLLRQPPTESSAWAWLAALPAPWRASVAEAGRRFGVAPSYLYGLMRQESAFAPAVESYAGARGLLQLMPETAAGVAERVGIEISDDMLFLPETNILLGTAYCGELLQEFSGVEALAIGAYNAGSHRIRAWLLNHGEVDLDRFVEDIPINQTRNYVRRVSTHQARYRYFADPSAGWPTLPPVHVSPMLLRSTRSD